MVGGEDPVYILDNDSTDVAPSGGILGMGVRSRPVYVSGRRHGYTARKKSFLAIIHRSRHAECILCGRRPYKCSWRYGGRTRRAGWTGLAPGGKLCRLAPTTQYTTQTESEPDAARDTRMYCSGLQAGRMSCWAESGRVWESAEDEKPPEDTLRYTSAGHAAPHRGNTEADWVSLIRRGSERGRDVGCPSRAAGRTSSLACVRT